MISELVEQLIAPPEDRELPLTLHDYCEACGVDADGKTMTRAAVRVKLVSGRFLDFCRHHYLRHEPALAAAGATLVGVTPEDIKR